MDTKACVSCGAPVTEHQTFPYPGHAKTCPLFAKWMKKASWYGYQTDSTNVDIFTPDPSWRPHPDGGWGQYDKCVGPFVSAKAARRGAVAAGFTHDFFGRLLEE